MTREQIEINRGLIIKELRATKREGIDGLIALMDKYDFFTASCDSHDNSAGGTANHSLWVLHFARKLRADQTVSAESSVPEESLTMVCLCHDICDCTFPTIPNTVHGDRSEAILKKSGVRLEMDELAAVRYHSDETIKTGGPAKASKAGTQAKMGETGGTAKTGETGDRARTGETDGRARTGETGDRARTGETDGRARTGETDGRARTEEAGTMIHQLVHKADRLSVEYADSIPFGAEPAKPFRKRKADKYLDIIFDADDHRMWAGAKGRDDVFDGTETLAEFPVHHVHTIPVRPEGNGKDILVLSDDNAFYALMYLSEEGGPNHSEEGGFEDSDAGKSKGTRARIMKDLYRSDKVMFGYTDLIFYISRYPQYRSSYIAARNAKGFWGVIRVRENRKDNGEHLILQEKVVDYTWRSSEKAVEHMRSHSGRLIRVQDPDFYTKITL